MRTFLAELRARLDAPSGVYFRSLVDGSFDRDDFVATQIQFFTPVAHFNRPMMRLASRLPRLEERLALVENVWDEHGRGELARSHERTFLELLARLGAPEPDVRARPVWPEVQAFVATLDETCAGADPDTAVAMLGMIEDLFAVLSASIGRAIVARGWLAREAVVHYATHEVLDVEHAEAFHRLLEPRWAERRDAIAAGYELGGTIFCRLYDDLHRARARR